MNRNSDYDPSEIRLTDRPKPKSPDTRTEKQKLAGLKRLAERDSLLESLGTNPFMSGWEKLSAAWSYGHADANHTGNKILFNDGDNAFKKFSIVIRLRWKTILIAAVLTTAVNLFVLPHHIYHTYQGRWSRINILTGQVQYYYNGHW